MVKRNEKRADEKQKVQMIFERHHSPISSFRPYALESTCEVTKRTQLRDQWVYSSQFASWFTQSVVMQMNLLSNKWRITELKDEISRREQDK